MVDRELPVTSDDEDRVLTTDGRPYATVTDVCKEPNDDRD